MPSGPVLLAPMVPTNKHLSLRINKKLPLRTNTGYFTVRAVLSATVAIFGSRPHWAHYGQGIYAHEISLFDSRHSAGESGILKDHHNASGYRQCEGDDSSTRVISRRCTKWDPVAPGDRIIRHGLHPHPGPPDNDDNNDGNTSSNTRFGVLSRNIRGLYSNLAAALRSGDAIICLQECDLAETHFAELKTQASTAGYRAFF